MDNVLYKEISNKDGEALPEDQLKLRKHIDNLLVERVNRKQHIINCSQIMA